MLWIWKESVKASSALLEEISERFDEQIVDIPSSTNGRAAHRRAHRAVPGHEVLEEIVEVVRCIPRVVEQFVEVPKIAELKPAERGETAQEETLELLKFSKVSGAGSGVVLHEVVVRSRQTSNTSVVERIQLQS